MSISSYCLIYYYFLNILLGLICKLDFITGLSQAPSQAIINYTARRNLKGEEFIYLGMEFEGIYNYGEGMVAGGGGDWSLHILSREAGNSEG